MSYFFCLVKLVGLIFFEGDLRIEHLQVFVKRIQANAFVSGLDAAYLAFVGVAAVYLPAEFWLWPA